VNDQEATHPDEGRVPLYVWYLLTFIVSVAVFWLLREQAHSGDWRNWTRFLNRGWWYRLREPICLAVYQVPFLALKDHGVTAKQVIAGFSYVCGGASVCFALATLRLMTSNRFYRLAGLAAVVTSFGIVGIFLGHIEHYNLMSLGCFAYLYFGLRYLRGSSSIIVPALVLGLLGTTHLMAAWLFPSLLALPFLGTAARPDRKRRWIDLALALCFFAIPNLIVWAIVIMTYYDGGVSHLWEDVWTGRYSRRVHKQGGNPIGGGNRKLFWTLAEIRSWKHIRDIVFLLVIYSPAVTILGIVALARLRGAQLRDALKAPQLLFFISLLVPYLIYAFTWENGLGVFGDWDLFSHVTIFALFAAISLAVALPDTRTTRAGWIAAIAVSLALTGYLVIKNHHAHKMRDSGVVKIARIVGIKR
jgi:hypothetical protein